jgi:hypothetical protein
MATAKVAGATTATAEAMVTTSMAGGVAISKSYVNANQVVGWPEWRSWAGSRSGVIAGLDLGWDSAARPLGQASGLWWEQDLEASDPGWRDHGGSRARWRTARAGPGGVGSGVARPDRGRCTAG